MIRDANSSLTNRQELRLMTEPQLEEERDDAIVGRASRWSALVIVLIGAGVGVAYWRSTIKPPPIISQSDPIKPELRARSSARRMAVSRR